MRQVYKPRSLSQELTVQQVGEETLIYDERRHRAFCLNQVSSSIWRNCDGTQSVEEIAASAGSRLGQPVNAEVVRLALAQLDENGLMEPKTEASVEGNLAGLGAISRRNMMAKVGAGALVMLPAIAMVLAPKPADASAGGVVSSEVPDPGQ